MEGTITWLDLLKKELPKEIKHPYVNLSTAVLVSNGSQTMIDQWNYRNGHWQNSINRFWVPTHFAYINLPE